jgi:hypothetical protein
MNTKSKRYKKDAEKTGEAPVSINEAVDKIKSFETGKFDQTIECVLLLGIDPKQADQLVRGSLSLPHGVGKQKRVIAFCEDSLVEEAKKAGAIEAGVEDLVKKITDGWADFDVAIASPKVMGKVGKLGRVLGPQGKMPSPKMDGDRRFLTPWQFTAGKSVPQRRRQRVRHRRQTKLRQASSGEHRSVRQSSSRSSRPPWPTSGKLVWRR